MANLLGFGGGGGGGTPEQRLINFMARYTLVNEAGLVTQLSGANSQSGVFWNVVDRNGAFVNGGTANTWYTIVSVSGQGLLQGVISQTDYTGPTIDVEVTLDGVTKTLTKSPIAGDRMVVGDILASDDGDNAHFDDSNDHRVTSSNFLKYPAVCPGVLFEQSLMVRVRNNRSLVSGNAHRSGALFTLI